MIISDNEHSFLCAWYVQLTLTTGSAHCVKFCKKVWTVVKKLDLIQPDCNHWRSFYCEDSWLICYFLQRLRTIWKSTKTKESMLHWRQLWVCRKSPLESRAPTLMNSLLQPRAAAVCCCKFEIGRLLLTMSSKQVLSLHVWSSFCHAMTDLTSNLRLHGCWPSLLCAYQSCTLQQVQAVVNAGAIAPLIRLLSSEHTDVATSALCTLASIAEDGQLSTVSPAPATLTLMWWSVLYRIYASRI